ncbi:hypothetical protein MBAV_003578 [Candidatus Magnetobacterium bavaricum]|uniref:Uncharacterized protein n=1 Tax=Candidatus Magnetobacterium bavaricum TaxID=29290 RepID=A0A0F3GQP0_9BACT|nr:hypothetical protein MBAV_003578 [Candidatus Magnetobacterium bavaricum]
MCNLNEAEVGRSAAYVTDEDDVPDLCMPSPVVLAPVEPCVESGQGFLQEGYVWQSCGVGCLDGQLTCHGIKGGRHGYIDVLIFQGVLRIVQCHCEVPCLADVFKEVG